MAAANTYVPIATTNLSSAATDYTFTSISGSYTHLGIMMVGGSTTATYSVTIYWNGGTGAYNHGATRTIVINAGTLSHYNYTGQLGSPIMYDGWDSTSRNGYVNVLFPFYTSSVAKTAIAKATSGVFRETGIAGLGTAATTPITSIKISASGTTFVTGTTLTLFGILEA